VYMRACVRVRRGCHRGNANVSNRALLILEKPNGGESKRRKRPRCDSTCKRSTMPHAKHCRQTQAARQHTQAGGTSTCLTQSTAARRTRKRPKEANGLTSTPRADKRCVFGVLALELGRLCACSTGVCPTNIVVALITAANRRPLARARLVSILGGHANAKVLVHHDPPFLVPRKATRGIPVDQSGGRTHAQGLVTAITPISNPERQSQ
jgi:hypothetical protein